MTAASRNDAGGATPTTLAGPDDSSTFVAVPTDMLVPGTQVGEYVVGGLLGQGGFGTVYEAVHPIIGKRAAVKVLSSAFCNDRGLATRFVNEARAVNTIRHRNIVDVFSFGQLPDGRLFFIMEMLEGETLQAYLHRRTKLEVDEALHIFTAIAKALEATHAAGIIHRDLKPANVFLAVDLAGEITPKLLDFGVAKLGLRSGEEEPTSALTVVRGVDVTGEGAILGTPSYMAPEQSLGETITAQADVYAFGVMLHRALTGKLPFERGHALAMALAHVTATPPAMSEVSEVSSTLDAAVLHMLEKSASDRPGTITEALAALAVAANPPPGLAYAPRLVRPLRRPARRRVTFKRRLQARAKPVPLWWWAMPLLLAAFVWVALR